MVGIHRCNRWHGVQPIYAHRIDITIIAIHQCDEYQAHCHSQSSQAMSSHCHCNAMTFIMSSINALTSLIDIIALQCLSIDITIILSLDALQCHCNAMLGVGHWVGVGCRIDWGRCYCVGLNSMSMMMPMASSSPYRYPTYASSAQSRLACGAPSTPP